MTLSITDAKDNDSQHNAECHYAEYRVLIIVMLGAIMLSGVFYSLLC